MLFTYAIKPNTKHPLLNGLTELTPSHPQLHAAKDLPLLCAVIVETCFEAFRQHVSGDVAAVRDQLAVTVTDVCHAAFTSAMNERPPPPPPPTMASISPSLLYVGQVPAESMCSGFHKWGGGRCGVC